MGFLDSRKAWEASKTATNKRSVAPPVASSGFWGSRSAYELGEDAHKAYTENANAKRKKKEEQRRIASLTQEDLWMQTMKGLSDAAIQTKVQGFRPDGETVQDVMASAKPAPAYGAYPVSNPFTAKAQEQKGKLAMARAGLDPMASDEENETRAYWDWIDTTIMQNKPSGMSEQDWAGQVILTNPTGAGFGLTSDDMGLYKAGYAKYSGLESSIKQDEVDALQKAYEDTMAKSAAWDKMQQDGLAGTFAGKVAQGRVGVLANAGLMPKIPDGTVDKQRFDAAVAREFANSQPLTPYEQWVSDYYSNRTVMGIDEQMAANAARIAELTSGQTYGQEQGSAYLQDAQEYKRLKDMVDNGQGVDTFTPEQRELWDAYESGNGLEWSNNRYAQGNKDLQTATIQNQVLSANRATIVMQRNYEAAAAQPDFKAKSVRDTAQTDELYNFINDQGGKGQRANEILGITPTIAKEGKWLDAGYGFLRPEEIRYYNYIVATQGLEAGKNVLDELAPELALRRAQDVAEDAKQFAEDYGGWSTLATYGTNLVSGITAPLRAIDAIVNPDHSYLSSMYDNQVFTDVVREARGAEWGKATDKWEISLGDWKMEFGPELGQWLYGLQTSGGDMLVAMAAGKGVQKLGGSAAVAKGTVQAIMSSEAGGATMYQAMEQGIDPGKAVVLGLGSAAIEWLTEKYSLEELLREPKHIRSYIAKNITTEASEEGASNLLNLAWDTIVLGDQGAIMTAYEAALEANGGDEKAAARQVLMDKLGELGMDMLGGALLGGGMASVPAASAGAKRYVERGKTGKAINANEAYSQLRSIALTLEGTKAQTLAKELEDKKKISNQVAGRLYQQVMDGLSKEAGESVRQALTQTVADRLTELGEQGDVQAGAAALQKMWMGEKLSPQDRAAIDSLDNAKQVMDEVFEQKVTDVATAAALPYQMRMTQVHGLTRKQAPKKAVNDAEISESLADDASVTFDNADAEKGFNAKTAQGEIMRVAAIGDDPQIVVQTEGGKEETIPLSQLEADSYNTRYALGQIGGMSVESANEMLAYARVQGGNTRTFVNDYTQVYRDGVNGYGMTMASNMAYGKRLNPDIRQKAYDAGQRDSEAQYRAQVRRDQQKGKRKGKVTFEGITRESLNDQQLASVEVMEAIADKLGVDIVFFASKADATGRYQGEQGSYKDGVIRLDVNAGRNSVQGKAQYAILRTAAHELTHHIAERNRADYQRLQRFVVDNLMDKGLEQLIEEKQAQYAAQGVDLTREQAIEEVVADGCEMMLKDSQAIQKLVEQDRNLAQKVLDWLRNFIDKLRKAFDGVSYEHREAALLMQKGTLKYLEGLQELWDQALMGTVEGEQTEEADFENIKYQSRGLDVDAHDVDTLKKIGRKSVFAFTSDDIKNSQKWGEMFWNEIGEKSPFFRAWFGDWREYDNAKVNVVSGSAKVHGDFENKDTGWYVNIARKVFTETNAHRSDKSKAAVPYLDYIDGIVENAVLLDSYVSDKEQKYSTMFHHLYAIVKEGENFTIAKLVVEQIDDYDGPNKIKRAYKLVNVTKTPIKRNSLQADREIDVLDIRVHDLYKLVKMYDNSFNPKAVNPAMLEPDGKPKRFYHGTAEEFWQFDKRKANDAVGRRMGLGAGKGKFYLSEFEGAGKAAAYSAASMGKGKNPRVMELYVSAQKVMERSEYEQRLRDEFKKYPNSDPFSDYYDYKARDKAIAAVDRVIRKEGYDGVWDRESGEMFVYEPTQIKSATDNIGTFYPENPDIRYQLRDGDTISSREALANALESTAQNQRERELLTQYKGIIKELDEDEAKLAKHKGIIRDLSFKKGGLTAHEKVELEKAKNRAQIVQNRLNRNDKKLLELESTKALKAVVEREKAKAEKRIREQKKEALERYRQRTKDTQSRAHMRDRIKDEVKKLNKLLTQETDTKHVPEELKGAVADFLTVFVQDTSVFSKAKLDELRYAYGKISDKASADEMSQLSAMYDEDITRDLEELRGVIDGKRLAELDASETKKVLNIVHHFNKLIKEANAAFVNGKRQNYGQMVHTAVQQADAKKPYKEIANSTVSAVRKLLRTEQITPPYFFKELGGIMKQLWDDLKAGESKVGLNVQKAQDFFYATADKYHYWDWAHKKNDVLEMNTQQGHKIALSREQAMGLYATWKREMSDNGQQAGHLAQGGFILEEKVTKGKNGKIDIDTRDPHKMTDGDMNQVASWLTEEQRGYVDEMVRYMSVDMAALGNETSMALFGYKKYGEPFYYPYNSSKNFTYTALGQQVMTNDQRLKHSSFTRKTVQFANNPIIASDFTQVWSAHVNHMILYNAMCVPLENFNRVYNGRYTDVLVDEETGEPMLDADGKPMKGSMQSVKQALEAAYGKNALRYIENLMADLNGGVRVRTDGMASALVGKFKKSAVMMSMSVVVQQPSAMVRAMALVNPKYFMPGLSMGGSWKELKKYSGIAVIKEMGGFDTQVGQSTQDWLIQRQYEGMEKLSKEALMDKGRWNDLMGWLPGKADQMTWTWIWGAVKAEVADKTGLTGEALMQEAAKRFDEVVAYTQVYDSTLSRSQLMRSKDGLAKMVTSFMSEPTLTYNMLMDALVNRGKADSVNPARAIGAFVATAVVNALLKSLVTAARDDDKEKSLAEKYVGNVVENVTNDVNPLNLIPYARDIVSLLQGYDVERTDMSLVNDLITGVQKALTDDDLTMYERVMMIAQPVAAAFGIPLKNVMRDLGAVVNVATGTLAPENSEFVALAALDALPFRDSGKTAYYERVLDARAAGDDREEELLTAYLASSMGVNEKTIKSKTKEALGNRYKAGRITDSKAIDILTDYYDLDDDDAYWQLKEWREKAAHKEDEDFSFSRQGELKEALESGNSQKVKTAQKELMDNGYAGKDVYSDTRSAIKAMYKDGTITWAKAKSLLTSHGGSDWVKEQDTHSWYWLEKEWAYDKANKDNKNAPEYSKYATFKAAIPTGKGLYAAARELLDHGVEKGTVSRVISDTYKEEYIRLQKTDKTKFLELRARLLTAYDALGYKRSERIKHLDKYWVE